MLKRRMIKLLEKLLSQRDGIHSEHSALLQYTKDYHKRLSIIRKVLVQEKEMFEGRKVRDVYKRQIEGSPIVALDGTARLVDEVSWKDTLYREVGKADVYKRQYAYHEKTSIMNHSSGTSVVVEGSGCFGYRPAYRADGRSHGVGYCCSPYEPVSYTHLISGSFNSGKDTVQSIFSAIQCRGKTAFISYGCA